MKRSVNFRGNKATVTRKALGARSLLATMKFVGMTEEEQRSFLPTNYIEIGRAHV